MNVSDLVKAELQVFTNYDIDFIRGFCILWLAVVKRCWMQQYYRNAIKYDLHGRKMYLCVWLQPIVGRVCCSIARAKS